MECIETPLLNPTDQGLIKKERKKTKGNTKIVISLSKSWRIGFSTYSNPIYVVVPKDGNMLDSKRVTGQYSSKNCCMRWIMVVLKAYKIEIEICLFLLNDHHSNHGQYISWAVPISTLASLERMQVLVSNLIGKALKSSSKIVSLYYS